MAWATTATVGPALFLSFISALFFFFPGIVVSVEPLCSIFSFQYRIFGPMDIWRLDSGAAPIPFRWWLPAFVSMEVLKLSWWPSSGGCQFLRLMLSEAAAVMY
ncbi:hypothetical protein Rs2_22809 [Raphanus sativus]|nr:hypothetical protein Rs2_22809 [Raphanus sativus]